MEGLEDFRGKPGHLLIERKGTKVQYCFYLMLQDDCRVWAEIVINLFRCTEFECV